MAEQVASSMRSRLGGSTQKGNAPFLHVRVSPRMRRRLVARAHELKVTPSRLVRMGVSWVLETNTVPTETLDLRF